MVKRSPSFARRFLNVTIARATIEEILIVAPPIRGRGASMS
jgi:hypothetical protein